MYTDSESTSTFKTSSSTRKSCLKRSSTLSTCSDSGSESSSSVTTKSAEKQVSFTAVEIKEFPMVLGENPSCCGIPVQIAWESQHSETMSLDAYEETKSEPPRKGAGLLLSDSQRRKIVEGTPMNEIDSAVRESNQIKKYRRFSVDSMSSDEWDYKMERWERKVKSVLKLKFMKKKKSDDLRIMRNSMGSVPSTIVAS